MILNTNPVINNVVVEHMLQLPGLNHDMIVNVSDLYNYFLNFIIVKEYLELKSYREFNFINSYHSYRVLIQFTSQFFMYI